ncbi:MAG TPA: ribosome maturation factor RimP [Gaiellales bacterium]|jgi:ribosome maturation factor RimP|nr:ribosome maturation factor RimP [Gaiellales bacterium]
MTKTPAFTDIQQEIEETLGKTMPEVEVLLAERPSAGRVRVFIDRDPGGVDLALCEQVTHELAGLRDRYALEVSSPGLDRPLTRPRHFARVVGETVSVRTHQAVDGRKTFTGRLLQAGDEHIDIDQDGQTVRLSYPEIRRSNLVFDPAGGRA